jgi:two-component system, OmpR family, response regulator
MRILLVEDNQELIDVLSQGLAEQNYTIDVALDGEAGWELVEVFPYDLIVLDVVLPKLDGISFCRRLREQKNPVLVMLLTARDTITDKLIGLDSGADDYVVKPVNLHELAARIRALSRRISTTPASVLICHELRLDPSTKEVTYAGQMLQFSRKEYLILELFLRNQQRVFSRGAIVDHVWSYAEEPPDEATVKSHIKNIRRELKAVGAGDLIETVYGQGYRINPAYFKPSDPAETTEAKEQTLDLALSTIWQRTKGSSLEKVTVLEHCVQALKINPIDPTQCQKAITLAHQLAGSLGTFGLETGSHLAHQIEDLLRTELQPVNVQPASPCLQQLDSLVATLHQQISQGIAQQSQSSPMQLPAIPSSLASLKSATVLAIDDDPQILITLKTILTDQGLHLSCLKDSTHFWQGLETVQPDLLILDINMPQVNGLEVCRSIRDHAKWGWLPILFLTVQSDPETIQQVFTAGADDYITKPIVPIALITRVLNRLQRSNTLSQRIKRLD